VPALQTPCAVPLVHPTEFLGGGRIIAGRRPVAHLGELRPTKQRHLPHAPILSCPHHEMPAFDHANSAFPEHRETGAP
jgi:hypothetical protein